MIEIADFFHPLGNEKYKAILSQTELNQILIDKVLPLKPRLKTINVDVNNQELLLSGVANPILKEGAFFKPNSVHFEVVLHKHETFKDSVLFDIKKIRVFSPSSTVDYVRFFNFLSSKLKKLLMAEFCKPGSPFEMTIPLKQMRFHFDFIMRRIPENVQHLGHINILNVSIESEKIIWFLESNLLLRSILDTLGPKFIHLEKFDPDRDTLRLLTDFPARFYGS